MKSLELNNSIDKKTGHNLEKIDTLEESVSQNQLFHLLDRSSKGYIYKKQLLHALHSKGILCSDPRLHSINKKLAHLSDTDKIDAARFAKITKGNIALIENALTDHLIIPLFEEFGQELKDIYEKTCTNREGELPTYIPQLACVNPEQYGIAICTIDGQAYSVGDANTYFCIQSACKPINYCVVQKELGEETVHSYIGKEPSGHGFNVIELNKNNQPHNPMVNSGAIMACALIKPELEIADRLAYIMDIWNELCGGIARPQFNNAVYLSEKQTADRNFAIGHFMREKKAFPPNTNLNDVLDFYFQCCSIEMTAESLAVVAATLANTGVCPLTGKRIFDPNTAKNCLSLMYSCGMYDFSGEFAFTIGLPAKSGVSGVLMVVIPNIMGICIWSPRLDKMGNSIRGIEFCKELVNRFNFHNYDSLMRGSQKKDPRRNKDETKLFGIMSLLWAASRGDLSEIKRLVAMGLDLNEADYDGRTALHLAASHGQNLIVKYLINRKVHINPVDRWKNTPLDDANRHHHEDIVTILKRHRGKSGIK